MKPFSIKETACIDLDDINVSKEEQEQWEHAVIEREQKNKKEEQEKSQ